MANFFASLWESIFTPGTTPQLIIATHISFFLLGCLLVWLIVLTNSIHFYALLTIALLLWAIVTWFISELNQLKLKSNQELEVEQEKNENQEQPSNKEKIEPEAKTTGAKRSATKSRKV